MERFESDDGCFELHKQPGDGSCLLHCVLNTLKDLEGLDGILQEIQERNTTSFLREKIVEWGTEKWSQYGGLHGGIIPKPEGNDTLTKEEWAASVSIQGSYLGEVEMRILSDHCNLHFIFYEKDSDKPDRVKFPTQILGVSSGIMPEVVDGEDSIATATPPIKVYLLFRQDPRPDFHSLSHYDLLVKKEPPSPAEMCTRQEWRRTSFTRASIFRSIRSFTRTSRSPPELVEYPRPMFSCF